jgi:hypothetical protein
VKLQKTYVNIEDAESCKAWCSLVKRRERVFVEASVAADIWRVEKE